MPFTEPAPSTTPSTSTQSASFGCVRCGLAVSVLGPEGRHRDHCPSCLHSRHVHDRAEDGDRGCEGRMTPISVVVARGGRWQLIHRCVRCDELSESDVTADDNQLLLLRIAVRPLAEPPFPLEHLGEV